MIEVTEPLEDILLDRPALRVQILVRLEGEPLGQVELPASEGLLRAEVIRASIADQFAWVLLARYFARTAYAPLQRRSESTGWSWWNGGRLVARVNAGTPEDDPLAALHDAIGWKTLIDALWPAEHPLVVATSSAVDRIAGLVRGTDDGREHGMPRSYVIDVGSRLPAFVFGRRNVAVDLRIGDVVVSSVEYVVGPAGIASGRALRTAVIEGAGPSLARAVVREAVIGMPLDATPLRERLARGRARALESARAR
ncbi:MAG: hypothetical protein ABI601_01025 [bacterium]